MAGIFPTRYFSCITTIDPQTDILDAGFRHVLLDVDNTILPRDTHQVPQEIRDWIAAGQAIGLDFCLISNNFHHGVYEWADRLGLPIVAKAVKPLPHAFIWARHKQKFRRKETLVIGDQLVTDVWGAHFTGMKCYMVDPLVDVDLKHTLLLRHVQRAIMGKRTYER